MSTNNKMRRMNSRSPPFAIVGLIFVCVFMGYNYWTLFSQNKDLKKDIEKLQTEIKIEGLKQEQFDKKNRVLQSNIHDLSEKSEKLQQKVNREDVMLKEQEENLQNNDAQMNELKNSLAMKEQVEKLHSQQMEDKDSKIEQLLRDSQHILTLKNEAEEALADKDSQINHLKMQLDQLKVEVAAWKTKTNNMEKMDLHPKIVQGSNNLPNLQNQEKYLKRGSLDYVRKSVVRSRPQSLEGFRFQKGSQILPRQSSNVPRAKPRFSAADFGNNLSPPIVVSSAKKGMDVHHNNVIPNPPLDKNDVHVEPVKNVVDEPKHLHDEKVDEGASVLNPVINVPVLDDALPNVYNEQQNVIPEPPQKPAGENPDTAIDDTIKEQVDPLDDQDEEGKEIQKDLGNNANENYDNYAEDDGLGGPQNGLGEPQNNQQQPNNKQLDNDDIFNNDHHQLDHPHHDQLDIVEEDKGNERVFDTNFEKKIRNIGAVGGRRHL